MRLMRRTRVIGIVAATLIVLSTLQEAAETLFAYSINESKSWDVRFHVVSYISWLVFLLLALILRICILRASTRTDYRWLVGSWLVVVAIVISCLYIYARQTSNQTVCGADGVCFNLYDISRSVILYPAATIYIFLGLFRSAVTLLVAAIRLNRKYK